MQWISACLWKQKVTPISPSFGITLDEDRQPLDWTPLRHKYIYVNKLVFFDVLDKMENLLKEMERDMLSFREETTHMHYQEEGAIYSTPLESKKSTIS
jgi:hypothetical protein